MQKTTMLRSFRFHDDSLPKEGWPPRVADWGGVLSWSIDGIKGAQGHREVTGFH